MEDIIRKVLANYFDTTKETQTQHLTPNYNSHTLNDFIDYDQEQLQSILPILSKHKLKKSPDVIQALDTF